MLLDKLKEKNFEIETLYHAGAILEHDINDAAEEIENVLSQASISVEELVQGGGGESVFTQRLRRTFNEEYGWEKHNFQIKKIVDNKETERTSHEIDHVKSFDNGTVALELEWNNKDQFYDRDLGSFERLHAESIISLGVIVTRGESLQENFEKVIEEYAKREGVDSIKRITEVYKSPTSRQENLILKASKAEDSFEAGWAKRFVRDKFGTSTTHWNKLIEKTRRGAGSPCPLLLIGLPIDIVKY